MTIGNFSRRVFVSVLVGTMCLAGAVQAFSPAAGADTGPTSLSASPWQVFSDMSIYSNPSPSGPNGDPTDFTNVTPALVVPGVSDPGWADCGPNAPIRYSPYQNPASLCPNPATIDMHVGSILSVCRYQENFTFFQSLVSIPAGTNVSEFSVSLNGADDGARVSIYNSTYPNGLVVPGSYIALAGGAGATPNLSPYVVPGEVNRVVITQVDDCPVGNNLNSAQILLNGSVLQNIAVSASTTSTTWQNTATISSSGNLGGGAVSYSLDTGSNGNTSDGVCSLNGTTLSASGPGKCYVYATVAANGSYPAATSSDVEVTFTNPTGGDPTVTCTTSASIFNTGYDATTQSTLPNGAQDPNWLVAGPYGVASPAEPAAPPSNAAYAPASVYTISAYYEDPSYTSSQYIGSPSGAEANYYFEYNFNLDPSVNPANFKLGMDFYADNQVAQVYVNGTPQMAAPQGGSANDQYGGFVAGNAASTTLSSGWQSGQNTIVVDVLNGGGPYSFDAQMRTSASCTATPPTITNIPATGSAVYGGSFNATVGGTNSDGVQSVTSDTPATCTATGTNGLTINFVGAGTCTLTSHVAEGSIYLPTDGTPQSFTIAPALLTVTASSPPDMTYGGSVPAVSPSYSGFVNGDAASSLTTAPSCGTTASSSSSVGTYDTSCSGASDPNYDISYVNGSLNVDQAPLTITASDAGMNYGGTVPTIHPIYSGFVNGDSASSLTSTPTCTTTATSASSVAKYSSSCTGAADPNYSISYTDGTVTIAPVTLTITASSPSMTYGDTAPTVTATYSGFVNGDSPASLTSLPVCTTTAGPTSQVGSTQTTSCSGASDPNYTIVYAEGSVTINPAPLTITASDTNSVYGSAVPAVTASYSGFVNGEDASVLGSGFGCTTQASASSPVGDSYTTSCSGANDANYAITYVNGTSTITPAPLTITASSSSTVYGSAVPVVTPSFAGFVNGEDASVLGSGFGCSTSASASSNVGDYKTSCSGASDTNYTITYVNGTAAITPAPLTITASDTTSVYGSAVPAVTASYSGFVNGDSASSLTTQPVCTTKATATSPAGDYKTSCSGASDNNYAITYERGTSTITPAPLTITASSPTMTYAAAVPAITPSYTGFVNGDSAASLTDAPVCTTTATTTSQPGTYPTSCTGASDPNYTISYLGGTLNLLLVAACPNSVYYGTGANLANTSFSGKNMTGKSFVGDNLVGANFNGTNLKDANFAGADLQGASFKGANLMGANFAGANLYGASLQGTNLMGDNVSCADFQGASLTGANLKSGNLSGDNLENVSFEGVNLMKADLSNSNMTGATFTGANTKDADWTGATCPDGSSANSDGGSCSGTL
ncbi:MAG: MBG domain-containing protein [Acidimicrobiales bacterium]